MRYERRALLQRRHARPLPLHTRRAHRSTRRGPRRCQPPPLTMGTPLHEYGRIHRETYNLCRRTEHRLRNTGEPSARSWASHTARSKRTGRTLVFRRTRRSRTRWKHGGHALTLGGCLPRTRRHGRLTAHPEPELRTRNAHRYRARGCRRIPYQRHVRTHRVLPLPQLRI